MRQVEGERKPSVESPRLSKSSYRIRILFFSLPALGRIAGYYFLENYTFPEGKLQDLQAVVPR